MPSFVIFPIWLALLIFAAALACFRVTRVLAVYIAIASTSALLYSVALSTAVIVLLAKFPLDHASNWIGVLLLGGYLGSIGIGAALGALAGVLIVWRMRQHKCNTEEASSSSLSRPMFGPNR